MSEVLQEIAKQLYVGKFNEVSALTQQALDEGLPPAQILKESLIAGMDVVGRDFKAGDLYVPEVLVAAKAMHAGMDVLRPLLVGEDIPTTGCFLIGTVQGDLHDIGKNLVAMMMEGAGFEVLDLGINAAPGTFVDAIRNKEPQLVGMSALLTTTRDAMKVTIEAIAQAGLRDRVKIMVGGAPVTAKFAEEIGADGYAPDAGAAVDKARELINA
jgi:5-methyltetrahydrofolate--homocysteine methyltransferase